MKRKYNNPIRPDIRERGEYLRMSINEAIEHGMAGFRQGAKFKSGEYKVQYREVTTGREGDE